MNKFKGYLICTDCDGTLTDNEGKVSDANAEAIKYFEKEGGLFTLATGRFPHFANNFKDKFKVNAPIVSLNGAVLYDINAEKMLNSWKMEKERFAKVLRYVNEEWPKEAHDYVEYLEKAVGCKITYISVGAEREAYIHHV